MNLKVYVSVPTYQYLVTLSTFLQHAMAWIHTSFLDTAAVFFAISSNIGPNGHDPQLILGN